MTRSSGLVLKVVRIWPVPLMAASSAAAEVATANLLIVPDTLGQRRLRWNVNFPGDLNRALSCHPKARERTVYTNIASYAFSRDGNTLVDAID